MSWLELTDYEGERVRLRRDDVLLLQEYRDDNELRLHLRGGLVLHVTGLNWAELVGVLGAPPSPKEDCVCWRLSCGSTVVRS